MKVALITPGVTPLVMGGMQRHSYNLVKHLARAGMEVDLYHTDFTARSGEGLNEDLFGEEAERVNDIQLAWKSDRLPGHYLRSLKRMSDDVLTVFQSRPLVDFVIGKSLTAWAFVEGRRAGIKLPPIGVNVHGFEMYQRPASFRDRLAGSLLRPSFDKHLKSADYVFSYGGKITDIARNDAGIHEERILEIPGGVGEEWFGPLPSRVHRPRRFLFLGRYERRKGIQELHEAIDQNPRWADGAEFVFVGPIPEEVRLRLPHVEYVGGISDSNRIQDLLRSADVLVCPSYSEGMPNSILEGMASGLAVIATDVGAVRLMVSERNGVLLERVSVKGVAGAIEKLIHADESELLQMRKESFSKSREFSWDRIAETTIRKIQGVLKTQ